MARPKRLQGIQSRRDADGSTRYRGSAYIAQEQRRGPWTSSLEEATAWRERALADARAGLLAHKSVTLREAIAVFCAGIADGSIRNRSGRAFKPSVIRDYTRDLGKIDMLIGASRLDEIRVIHAQRVLEHLQRAKLSDSSVRHAMMALRSLYQWAKPVGLATVNPCEGLRLPVSDERKRERIASPHQAALLTAALPVGDRAAFGLACYAGLRAGELLALAWEHVDGDVVRVERSYDHGAAGFIAPKSEAAHRVVPILDPLKLILEDHRFAKLAKVGDREAGLLFPSSRDSSRPFSYRALTTRMSQRWDKAELEPIGLHEARHTFASLMIAAGVNPKALSTYMGHASIQITYDRYGHLFPGSEAEARDRVNAYLRSQMEESA